MKKKKSIISSDEFINTMNDICNIYKENFEIVYNYFLSLYPKYHFYTFDLVDKNKIILMKDSCVNTYFYRRLIVEKEIIILKNDDIETMIYKSQDKKLQDAYKTLQEMIPLTNSFYFKCDKKRQYVSYHIDFFKKTLEQIIIEASDTDYHEYSQLQKNELLIRDDNLILKNLQNTDLVIENYEEYEKLKRFVSFYNFHHRENLLFDKFGKLYENLKGMSLEDYDLKKVDWTNKNIAGIDITHNPEVNINFDKIIKDLSNANISGYNLNEYRFVGWNLSDTNLKNTSATIDLATCMITLEGKMNPGTLFDESNTFMFGQNKLSQDEVKKLGIKIYKRG